MPLVGGMVNQELPTLGDRKMNNKKSHNKHIVYKVYPGHLLQFYVVVIVCLLSIVLIIILGAVFLGMTATYAQYCGSGFVVPSACAKAGVEALHL